MLLAGVLAALGDLGLLGCVSGSSCGSGRGSRHRRFGCCGGLCEGACGKRTGDQSIRSLRYAVLLASSGQGLAQGMDSTVCGRWAELGGAAADCDTSRGQLYQLVTGSLTLRNLMP